MAEEGEEGKEVSSQQVDEVTVPHEAVASLGEASGVSSTPSTLTFDLNITTPSASLASTDSILVD